MTERPTTVVVIDDHTLFARGLELMLEEGTQGHMRVVGRTADAGEAEDLVRRCRPDVALVDLAMPPPGGIGAIRAIRHRHPSVQVLALSGSDDTALALEALAAGAVGFIPKSSDPEVLAMPIDACRQGWGIVPSALLQDLLQGIPRPVPDRLRSLSDEETTVLRMIASGLETTEIAAALFVSPRTAKRLTAAILHKLGAANRVHAAAIAGAAGLVAEADLAVP